MTTLQEQRDQVAEDLLYMREGVTKHEADHNAIAFIDMLMAERKATADFLQTVCIWLGTEEYAIPRDVLEEALKIANNGLPE